MKKIKIAILCGGPSSEHEVSLKSAENVVKALDSAKFEVFHIKITMDRVWIHQEADLELTEEEGLAYLKKHKVDIVFIALHGEFGEDGTIQKILEAKGFKYTGSDSQASNIAMDKTASSAILTNARLKVPSFITFDRDEWVKNNKKIMETINVPVVIKPTDRGSSVGVTIVDKRDRIKAAVLEALKYSGNVMVQEYIEGRELTCAVIENGEKDIPLVPTEIIPKSKNKLFDYESKYLPDASIEVTPPQLPKKMIKLIQESALRAHRAINCRHISRSDFILQGDVLYILEVNTLPGLTKTSLVPQGAAALGIDFPMLMEILIETTLHK